MGVRDDQDLVRGERRQRVGDREQRIRVADLPFHVDSARLELFEIRAHSPLGQAAGAAVV